MKYLSICSGIEAASVAWHDLGWTPVGFSEIEPFPCAVLQHRFPTVPNFGDMTKFNEWPICSCVRRELSCDKGDSGFSRHDTTRVFPGAERRRDNSNQSNNCTFCGNPSIDILVGGTPCQAFSVAGLRKGLADPRGNLTLTFLAMVEHFRPRWVIWENVPGVLSERTGAFGSFLGGLGELGYGWSYRILDAQYFGVAQRRRRVFVVGHLGAWQRAAAVLFEPESLRGDSAPSREAGERPAGNATSGAAKCGITGPLTRCGNRSGAYGEKLDSNLLVPDIVGTLSDGAHNGGGLTAKTPTRDGSLPCVAMCLNAGAMGRKDAESETLIPCKNQ